VRPLAVERLAIVLFGPVSLSCSSIAAALTSSIAIAMAVSPLQPPGGGTAIVAGRRSSLSRIIGVTKHGPGSCRLTLLWKKLNTSVTEDVVRDGIAGKVAVHCAAFDVKALF
jgi:hypothetical protein